MAKEYHNDYEMLKAEAEKTVVEIRTFDPSNRNFESGELLLKMEQEGYAHLEPDRFLRDIPDFFQNHETRKQLEEFVQNMQNSGRGEEKLIAIEHQMKDDSVLYGVSHPFIDANAIAEVLEKTSELEMLKSKTTKTVMTISEADVDEPLMKVEMDGYAGKADDFFKNNDTREKLADLAENISAYEMNDTAMKYNIQHFKDEEPLDKPVGSVFKGNDIANTLDNIKSENTQEKENYTK